MPLRRAPHQSGVHRVAAIALYRALLTQCTSVPLPSPCLDGIRNIVRNRFRATRCVTSHRHLHIYFDAGYEALDHLDAAAAGVSESAVYLDDLVERAPFWMKRSPSLAQQKEHGTRKLPPLTPIDLKALKQWTPNYLNRPLGVNVVSSGAKTNDALSGAHCEEQDGQRTRVSDSDVQGAEAALSDPIFNRPLRSDKLTGKRRVPRLISANMIPILRVDKPQPPALSGYIANRITRRHVRTERWHRMEQELRVAQLEDRWDSLMANLPRSGIQSDRASLGRRALRPTKQVPGPAQSAASLDRAEPAWSSAIVKAISREIEANQRERAKNALIASKMQLVVEAEQAAFDLEAAVSKRQKKEKNENHSKRRSDRKQCQDVHLRVAPESETFLNHPAEKTATVARTSQTTSESHPDGLEVAHDRNKHTAKTDTVRGGSVTLGLGPTLPLQTSCERLWRQTWTMSRGESDDNVHDHSRDEPSERIGASISKPAPSQEDHNLLIKRDTFVRRKTEIDARIRDIPRQSTEFNLAFSRLKAMMNTRANNQMMLLRKVQKAADEQMIINKAAKNCAGMLSRPDDFLALYGERQAVLSALREINAFLNEPESGTPEQRAELGRTWRTVMGNNVNLPDWVKASAGLSAWMQSPKGQKDWLFMEQRKAIGQQGLKDLSSALDDVLRNADFDGIPRNRRGHRATGSMSNDYRRPAYDDLDQDESGDYQHPQALDLPDQQDGNSAAESPFQSNELDEHLINAKSTSTSGPVIGYLAPPRTTTTTTTTTPAEREPTSQAGAAHTVQQEQQNHHVVPANPNFSPLGDNLTTVPTKTTSVKSEHTSQADAAATRPTTLAEPALTSQADAAPTIQQKQRYRLRYFPSRNPLPSLRFYPVASTDNREVNSKSMIAAPTIQEGKEEEEAQPRIASPSREITSATLAKPDLTTTTTPAKPESKSQADTASTDQQHLPAFFRYVAPLVEKPNGPPPPRGWQRKRRLARKEMKAKLLARHQLERGVQKAPGGQPLDPAVVVGDLSFAI